MASRWACHQPDGGQRLDQDDGEARRCDHGHRLSVLRWPEDRQTRARRTARRQGNASLRPLGPCIRFRSCHVSLLRGSPLYWSARYTPATILQRWMDIRHETRAEIMKRCAWLLLGVV